MLKKKLKQEEIQENLISSNVNEPEILKQKQ